MNHVFGRARVRTPEEEETNISRAAKESTKSATARALLAINDTTAKPICEGGLTHYFISEAHRRASVKEAPWAAAAPSATLALAALPSSHRGRGDLKQPCAVCLYGGDRTDIADTDETITLLCGHGFHKRCIVGWVGVNSTCPCCRSQLTPGLEPYRYPANTVLRNAVLRARLGYVINWRAVALQSSQWEGRSELANLFFTMRAKPLTPPPALRPALEPNGGVALSLKRDRSRSPSSGEISSGESGSSSGEIRSGHSPKGGLTLRQVRSRDHFRLGL